MQCLPILHPGLTGDWRLASARRHEGVREGIEKGTLDGLGTQESGSPSSVRRASHPHLPDDHWPDQTQPGHTLVPLLVSPPFPPAGFSFSWGLVLTDNLAGGPAPWARPAARSRHHRHIPDQTGHLHKARSNQPTNRKPRRPSCPLPIVRFGAVRPSFSLGICPSLSSSPILAEVSEPLPPFAAGSLGRVSSALLSQRPDFSPPIHVTLANPLGRPHTPVLGHRRIVSMVVGAGREEGAVCMLPATINRVGSSHHH
jgi:hypothetical protein